MSDLPEVTELLREHKVTVPAVDVFRIIEENNIKLVREEMDDTDSGFLLIQGGNSTIALNASHHPNRQRFTAAHECGHYFLHCKGAKDDKFFVDQTFQRNQKAYAGTTQIEIQANRFAAELLMPEMMVVGAVGDNSISDLDISLLALRFEVSEQAMALRLVKLGLITP